jgi:bifunctional DNase/RNase
MTGRLVLALVTTAFVLSAGCDEPNSLAISTSGAKSSQPTVTAPSEPAVSDAAVLTPKGFARVRVGGISPAAQGNAVLLVDDEKQRALVVFIGDTEALSIQLRLQGTKYKRPLTHDLVDNMLEALGAKIHSVRVDKLHDDIFYGVVVVQDRSGVKEFDSRTSDGIALALGSEAPVFVAKEVLDRAAIALDGGLGPEAESPTQPAQRRPIAL